MKKFPRVYAESTISRMYRKLELPEETVELFHRYFDAFSTFYDKGHIRYYQQTE